MKLIVLSDNRTIDQTLETEHGLCIYLETDQHKWLLDTGASDLFIRNAAILNVNLADIDYVFISHGHADHIGGLRAFLQLNKKAKILISPNALNQGFFSKRVGLRNIGIELDTAQYPDRFIYIDCLTTLEPDIFVFPCEIDQFPKPMGNSTLYKETGNKLIPDDFNHELVMACGSNKILVFTGCAHKGLLNVLKSVEFATGKRPETVIGGFHLLDGNVNQRFETDSEIGQTAQTLSVDYPSTYFVTGHCTGNNAYATLKTVLKENIQQFHSGYSIEF